MSFKLTAAAVFVFFLEVWMENDSASYYTEYLQPFFQVKVSLILVVLLGTVLAIYHSELVKAYKEDLADNARLLLSAYDDLKDYKWRARILKALEKFTKNESFVLAAQLYTYSVKQAEGQLQIKINHLDGYVWEKTDLNAMVQTYYSLDLSLYRDFERARKKFVRGEFEELLRFIQKNNHEISTSVEINDRTAIQYALVRLALDLLEDVMDFEFFLDPAKVKKITNHKRTGILRGLLLKGEFYKFLHEGNSEKKGRVYLTKTITIKNTDHVFLLTLSPEILDVEDTEAQMENLVETLIEGMHKAEQITYNEDST
ncbi:hypothetical protein [Salinithrix halophila]|uniref:Uncharacterized protein n=1 Tax=Salinithrix halophila TaxID=1485204 RepID=A0ABV8JAV8_9BACL